LQKAATGIPGFDEITAGGLPKGRPSLICGGAGCGKSLFAVEFLVRGAVQYGEPGVLMTFEESHQDIEKNAASLGFNIPQLVAQKKLFVDYVHLDRSQIEENGEYDLEGLFLRLNHAVTSIGAKRVALDTIEALFSGLKNQAILRAELRRLFKWLKDRGLTAVITAERGEGSLTRHGLEEYVSDCVVLLDHRVHGQVSTRRLRVIKYRGSTHGTNEYPFLIDRAGLAVLPVTAASMEYTVSSKRIPSGIPKLDQMLGGKGFFRGSVVLLSGSSGTGKTSISAHLAHATCQRGERCLYFSFEEPAAQIMRNMKSIGLDLEPHVRKGLLQFYTTRPTVHGVEMHLVLMHRLIEEFSPSVVIVDPVSNIQSAGTLDDSTALLIRLVDFLRKQGITGFLCTLTNGQSSTEYTNEALSSMADTWLLLRDVESSGERNRLLYVLKSRGMHHSNQVREFLITSKGIQLIDAYLGAGGALTGSARLSQRARENAEERSAENELQRKKLVLEHRRKTIQAQIEALQLEYRTEEEEFERQVADNQQRTKQLAVNRQAMSLSRQINH
jgi:circadian clock protein KaiC